MAERLTEKLIKSLPAPSAGNRITYDDEVKGFGLRVTKSGAKAFVLNYRVDCRERRLTIGSHPDWTANGAREEAKALKRRIDRGEDPMAEREARRGAPNMGELIDRFETDHLSRRRPGTQSEYRSILKLHIRPELGTLKVEDIRHVDVERLHRKIARTAPYRANRTIAVLSKMMSLAVKWELRSDNPVKGVERAPEHKRERFLSPAEIARLGEALAKHNEITSANALRFLLLTGARRGEALAARWSEFELSVGVWTKPSAHTKQKKDHRVPLSAPALALLTEMRAAAEKEWKRGGPEPLFVFPSDQIRGKEQQPLTEIKRTWKAVCIAAGLAQKVAKLDAAGKPMMTSKGAPVMVWQHTVRIHDLRHSFASILASSGLSLPIIGALLGHTQAATTHRYAHLMDDPLRAATERVGAMISGAGRIPAEVVELRPKKTTG